MIRISLAAFVTVGVLAGGCTSFESIDRGVCGNGLIEAGEDCDSSASTCVRCAVVCATNMDCPTSDYACGVDGLCYAPGGALGAAVPAGPFQVKDLAITDIDRDRIGDVVGVSRTSIAVRYGEPTARLTRVDSLVTPTQMGNAAFGDLDDDGTLDITTVTPDGMVAYGSRFGVIAPIPVSSTIINDGSLGAEIRHTFPIGQLTLGAFAANADGMIELAVVDFLGAAVNEKPCGISVPAQAFSTESLDIYKAGPDDVVVSWLAPTTPKRLCVVALHKPLFAAWQFTDITPVSGTLSVRPVLADLEGDVDRCPGLVNADGGGMGLRWWNGSMTASGCTLQAGTQLLEPMPTSSTATVVGRLPLDPPVLGVASDLLVLSDGAYLRVPGTGFYQIYTSQRRIAAVNHADLDADGMIDGVLVAETEDDIEVLYRRINTVIPAFPGYAVFRIDTSSRVRMIEIADFDGNGLPDIAMVEQLTDYQRLSIAFGSADLLRPPAMISAFPEVRSMTSLGLPDTDDSAAVTDDLAVVQPPAPGRVASTLTIFNGSIQRAMTPYFDPRSDEDPDLVMAESQSPRAITDLRVALVGRFVATGTSGDAARDPVAIAVSRAAPVAAPQLWRIPGTSAGLDATESPGVATMGLADCVTGLGTGLCVRDAEYLTWPISPTRDVVVAVDRANPPHAAVLDPGGAGPAIAITAPAITAMLPPDSAVRSLHTADLDGDGVNELVISAAPRQRGGTASAVLVCRVDDGIPRTCEDLLPAIVDATRETEQPTTTCLDAAPARIAFRDPLTAPDGARDLVVVCRDAGSSIYRVHVGPAGHEVSLLARTPTRLGAVRIGDVTGDGVDDVVAIEGDSGAQSLVVFPQCSSRGLGSCSRGGGS